MNIDGIDLNLLRVFDAVLRERSVTAAASRLGLTQPAISNALARLRRLVGDPLFVRTPEGMAPTPLGRGLADPVHQALALIESALAHGAGFDPATSTRLFRFYMSDIGEAYFLPPLVGHVQALAPGVQLEAVGLDPEGLSGALATGALDLAVGFLPPLATPIRSRPLFRDPYVCLVRAGHPSIGERLTRAQFRDAAHALVSSMGSGHRIIEDTLQKHGLSRRIALRVPHFTVMPTVLARSDLVLTLPERIARAYAGPAGLRVLAPPVPIPPAEVGVHWHERFDGDPGNRWLRERLVELFAE